MDTVRIFSRYDFENPPTVSVLGDVRLPGTYQTSGQIHLADAVHLAGGLAPDAQTVDAQIFRYLPDGKFKIFSVSLSQALEGDSIENIVMQPRDRLLIHKNPDAVEPATVFIQGEVGKPGRYPLTTNMHVADLVRLSGGMKPSADAQTADLIQFQWGTPSKLIGQHQVIALTAALAGDANSNASLRNGDVLTIRQLPGWKVAWSAVPRAEERNTSPAFHLHSTRELLFQVVEAKARGQADCQAHLRPAGRDPRSRSVGARAISDRFPRILN